MGTTNHAIPLRRPLGLLGRASFKLRWTCIAGQDGRNKRGSLYCRNDTVIQQSNGGQIRYHRYPIIVVGLFPCHVAIAMPHRRTHPPPPSLRTRICTLLKLPRSLIICPRTPKTKRDLRIREFALAAGEERPVWWEKLEGGEGC